MAQYKNASYLTQSTSTAFDTVHPPGARVLNSGIYRCDGCGEEISHTKEQILPPQNHHQHTATQGAIRWRLVVYAETKR